jgi:hypothetical protein
MLNSSCDILTVGKWELSHYFDNGSTDRPAGAGSFGEICGKVECSVEGRAAAGLEVWNSAINGSCRIYDIDLSADLNGFGILCRIQMVMILPGSRLAKGSCAARSSFRKILSCAYNALAKKILKMDVSDAQCGFKLFCRGPVLGVLPFVKSDQWCFDTELLFFAFKKGLKVKEIPLSWKERDKGKSKVRIVPYVVEGASGRSSDSRCSLTLFIARFA